MLPFPRLSNLLADYSQAIESPELKSYQVERIEIYDCLTIRELFFVYGERVPHVTGKLYKIR